MADLHVISALKQKRAELSGELIAAEKRILQLRDDISSLDRTIRVFDPTSESHDIRPILRRKKPPLIPRGQCSRTILEVLRHADTAMTVREIAAQLAARYQMDTTNMDAMKALIGKVRNACAPDGARERVTGRCEGMEGGERGLAPRKGRLNRSDWARSEIEIANERSADPLSSV